MGYHLQIVRGMGSCADELTPIRADEWLGLVHDDCELRLVRADLALYLRLLWHFGGPCGPHFAIWSGPSKYRFPWLDWSEPGHIYSKNRDGPLIDKMVQIAARLGAKVYGDLDEEYLGAGQVVHPPGHDVTRSCRPAGD